MLPETSRWKDLLDLALPVLDHVYGSDHYNSDGSPKWTLGGGTAIAVHLNHRVSHDVDLFVPGVALRNFTPQRNPYAGLISKTFQWPGHYLKYQLDYGEIDFLAPPLQTEPGSVPYRHGSRIIALDTPEEVIVKKIRYRSARFTPRDAFDLAYVAEAQPSLTELLASETGDALPRVREAILGLQDQGLPRLQNIIVPTENTSVVLETAFERCLDIIATAERKSRDMNQSREVEDFYTVSRSKGKER